MALSQATVHKQSNSISWNVLLEYNPQSFTPLFEGTWHELPMDDTFSFERTWSELPIDDTFPKKSNPISWNVLLEYNSQSSTFPFEGTWHELQMDDFIQECDCIIQSHDCLCRKYNSCRLPNATTL
jgi:hypothetical protein